MDFFSALILYAVVWFMMLFVVLPVGLSTQDEEGEVQPGTPRSSPARFPLKRKLMQTTLWGTAVFVAISAVILSGVISVRDLDWFHRMSPVEAPAGDGTGG